MYIKPTIFLRLKTEKVKYHLLICLVVNVVPVLFYCIFSLYNRAHINDERKPDRARCGQRATEHLN